MAAPSPTHQLEPWLSMGHGSFSEMGASNMRLQEFHATASALDDEPVRTTAPPEFLVAIRRGEGSNQRLLQRRRLINTAVELFSRQGYQRTKLSDVARSAGYAASTIRREFRGKSRLLEEVIRRSGTCSRTPAPADSRTASLEDVIVRLATWEVNRMREQRERVQALLPHDSLDATVLHTTCKLSLFDSTEILHDRLRKHQLGDGERQVLVYMIQAIGLRLGWSRFAEAHQTASCIEQIATTLAGGLACCRAKGLRVDRRLCTECHWF